jgi:predicted NUDIX family NTP pyrophosphohydrolase
MRKDRGAWQIPKGLIEPGENAERAARREAGEELGIELARVLRPLGEIRQSGGKLVTAFAVEHDLDPAAIRSNLFEMEWPPRSGKIASFPEVAAARWMSLQEAREIMLPSQVALLDRLTSLLTAG